MGEDLYLIRMKFDLRRLYHLARRPALSHQPTDVCYLTHCALRELFPDRPPGPFCVMGTKGQTMEVLAYSGEPADALMARARRGGLPDQALEWASFASKKMPGSFAVGSRFRFRVRTCPVVRKARGSRRFRPKAEVDAFLSAVEKVGEGVTVDRESVYRRWLEDGIAREGGARCESVRLAAMLRSRFSRRDRERMAITIDRPDVTFEGTIVVTDSGGFRKLLVRGLGRHRSFGFGMMLLRPSRS
jgi:CRISPR system Cascade subunit CasE